MKCLLGFALLTTGAAVSPNGAKNDTVLRHDRPHGVVKKIRKSSRADRDLALKPMEGAT